MIKLWKFLTFFYRNLTLKRQKPLFILIISNFMKRLEILLVTKFNISFLSPLGGNGGVKNKMHNNGSILTGKITYQKSCWLDKNEVPRGVLSLLYNLIPGSRWQVYLILWTFLILFSTFFKMFKQYSCN